MLKHSQETKLQSRHRASDGPDPMTSFGTQGAGKINSIPLHWKWWLPGAPSLRPIYFQGERAQDWNVSAHSHALGRPDPRVRQTVYPLVSLPTYYSSTLSSWCRLGKLMLEHNPAQTVQMVSITNWSTINFKVPRPCLGSATGWVNSHHLIGLSHSTIVN